MRSPESLPLSRPILSTPSSLCCPRFYIFTFPSGGAAAAETLLRKSEKENGEGIRLEPEVREKLETRLDRRRRGGNAAGTVQEAAKKNRVFAEKLGENERTRSLSLSLRGAKRELRQPLLSPMQGTEQSQKNLAIAIRGSTRTALRHTPPHAAAAPRLLRCKSRRSEQEEEGIEEALLLFPFLFLR